MRHIVPLVGLAALLAGGGRQERGRPVIILVHGRGMVGRDSAATRQLWRDALISAGRTLTAQPLIEDGDVRVAWYADVLDPRSSDSCDLPPTDRRVLRDRAEDPQLRQFVGAVGGVLDLLTDVVDDTATADGLRGLAADASFLTDVHKRCAVESRLDRALDRARAEGRPVILVAHSMGSLVAYDLLSSRIDTGRVWRLITIGSPLGSPDLRHLLIGGDSSDTLAVPRDVGAWVNIRNAGDLFATRLTVGRDVVSEPPTDEADPHEMTGYLRGTIAAREVLGAWCSAFSVTRPSGCKDIHSD